MAKGNLQRCLEHLWPFEGGYVDHPKDPGGATNMGITFAVLQNWRGKPITKADVNNLTKAEAAKIYEARYWKPLNGDNLRVGDDLAVFDFGVHSGVSRSAKYSQAIAGVTQDGKIGPITLSAIARIPSRDFIKRLCARRLSFVQSLAIWNTFGKGWSRRIASVEATALSWVSSKSELQQDAKEARGAAGKTGTGAVGVGGAGTADQVSGASGLPLSFVIAAVTLIAGVFVVRTIIHAQRASALAAAAKQKD